MSPNRAACRTAPERMRGRKPSVIAFCRRSPALFWAFCKPQRALQLAACLVALVTLCSCMMISPIREEKSAGPTPVPIPPEISGSSTDRVVTLFFRYRDLLMLTTETLALHDAPDDKRRFVKLAVEALIAGPREESANDKLPVLPPTTKVLDVQGTDSLCTITLSADFLTRTVKGADIKTLGDNNQSMLEAERTRRLGVSALVSTIVQTGAYAQVQLLVDEGGGKGVRIQQRELGEASDELLGPLSCDESILSILLTPRQTLRAILESLRDRNAEQLYRFIAQRDEQGALRPTISEVSDFIEKSATLRDDMIIYQNAELLSGDGQSVTLLVHVNFLPRSGGVVERDHLPLVLRRENEVWKMDYDALAALIPQ